ncbi:MAG: hypothetical protein ACTSQP_22540 [Promethearchaeota archaeon]
MNKNKNEKNYFVFRVLHLKCNKIIKLANNIFILPSEINESGSTVYFDLQSYSYLVLVAKNNENKENLKKKVEIILSFFSILFANQIFFDEEYHFCLNEECRLIKVHLKSLPNFLREIYKSIPSSAYIKITQFIFKKWYDEICNNPIRDNLFYLIAEFNAGLRSSIFEIGAGLLWNVWEHLASIYWKNKDKKKLYVIRKSKFKEFIKILKNTADDFIKNLKSKDILLQDTSNGRYNYKSLLKRGLSKDFFNFTPIKYRVDKMLENEEKTLTRKEFELISRMYRIRNYLFHEGLTFKRIENKENLNLVEFFGKFKEFTRKKFLEFFGIIDKFAVFDDGIFTWKKEILRESSNEEIIALNGELLEIYNYIKRLNNIFGYCKDAKLKWNGKANNVNIKFYPDNSNNWFIKLSKLPLEFKKELYNFSIIHTQVNNQPEDLVKVVKPIKIIVNLRDYNFTFKIWERKSVKTNFKFENVISGRDVPKEFAKFKINEVIINKK